MADWQSEIDRINQALQQPQTAPSPDQSPPVTSTTLNPSPPSYQSEIDRINSALALPPPLGTFAPPVPETFGPPAPAAPYDVTSAAIHGFTGGLEEPVRSALRATTGWLSGRTQGFDYPEAAAEVQRGREAYAAAHPYANIASNVAGSIAGPIGEVAGLIKGASLPAKVALSTGTGAVLGGTQGAAENTTSLPAAMQGATTGAEWGAGTGAAFPIIGAIGSTVFPELTSAARTLRAAGVQPTPGNAVGGLPGVAENLLGQVPIVGAPIGAARTAAKEQFEKAVDAQLDTMNRNAVGQPLARIGETLDADTKTGHDAIAEMRLKLSNGFNRAVPTAGGSLDAQASQMITDAVANAHLNMNPTEANQFEKFVQTNILGKIQGTTAADVTSAATAATAARQQAESAVAAAQDQAMRMPGPGSDANLANATQRAQQARAAETQAQQQMQNVQMGGKPFGTLSGQDFQDTDRLLGDEAHRYFTRGDANQQKLAEGYENLQDELRSWLERVSPQNAADLKAANEAWRMAKPVLSAARATKNPDGLFSEDQLLAGSRANSTIPQFATGQAPMQQFANAAIKQRDDLATAGKSLRPPEGGHTGGLLAGGVLGASLLEHGPEILTHPALLTSAAVGYPVMRGLYSNFGRRMITGLLGAAGAVPSVTGALGPTAAQLAPQYAPVAGPYATGLLNPNPAP